MSRRVDAPSLAQLERAQRVIRDYLQVTPVAAVDVRGQLVHAKLESLQKTGSFKVRGGLAAVSAAHEEDSSGAVITSSAGNHGLGISYAATRLGVPATVVVPANASPAKVKKLQSYDIELIQHGSSYDDAQAEAMRLADVRGIRYISPFNDTHVIAGQATLFFEMLQQTPSLAHVVVPVGGGGLISGVLLAREAADRDDVRVTGVQPTNSCAIYQVLRGASMADIQHLPTIADGLAGGGDDGAVTNDIIASRGVELVLVDEELIRDGVREAAAIGLVLEGSAATPFAAISNQLVAPSEGAVGFIASGRNISTELLAELVGDK
jgi:threonine dehydratase